MIDVQNICKTFDDTVALSNLSVHAEKGSVYGLVGPNGAGKSTLMRILSGIYRPDSGQALINGLPVWENSAVKQRIAYIPDDLTNLGTESIRSLKALYSALYPFFDEDRYQKLREIFRLDEKKALRRFSKGMQKQAVFWLALCCRADVLLLDEPVDGLDPVMRRQIWSLIMEDVAERQTTVLISSHNLRELEDVCDHVGIMHHGQMLLERSLSELQDNIVKVQLVSEQPLPEGLSILHQSNVGRIQTLIIRGAQDTIMDTLSLCHPMLCEMIPLTLEEIFIYELGGVDYDVREIVL
ncbi:MAG: ABC transporter ATP-binding protein [Clostridia bacterium]|nr:ABC transporter ATP-binding protein [Clostridia bacterium]